MNKNAALALVLDELERAVEQHKPFNSPHEAYAVILEELEELWVEVKANNGRGHRGVSEAVQTAAMAMRYLVDLCDEPAAEQHQEKVRRHVPSYYTGGGGSYSG